MNLQVHLFGWYIKAGRLALDSVQIRRYRRPLAQDFISGASFGAMVS